MVRKLRKVGNVFLLLVMGGLVACTEGEKGNVSKKEPMKAVEVSDKDVETQTQLKDLVRGGTIRHAWGRGGQYLYYSEKNSEVPSINRIDLKTGVIDSVEPLLTGEAIDEPLSLYDGQFDVSSNTLYVEGVEGMIAVNLDSLKAKSLSARTAKELQNQLPRQYGSRFPQTPVFPYFEVPSPDRALFASILDGELSVRRVGGEATPISGGTPDHVVWNPFTFTWSSDSQYLAAIADDHRQSAQIPVIDWIETDFTYTTAYYPPPGSLFPQGKVQIFSIDAPGAPQR